MARLRRGTPEYSEHQRRKHLAAWARIKAGEGFLYLAELVGADIIKIGFSLNPSLRVRDPGCMHMCNGRGRLVATTPGTHAQERAIHRALKPPLHPRSRQALQRNLPALDPVSSRYSRSPAGGRMSPAEAKRLVGHSSPQPEAGICDRLRELKRTQVLNHTAARWIDEAADEIDRLRCALRAVRASTDPRWQAQIISDALREGEGT